MTRIDAEYQIGPHAVVEVGDKVYVALRGGPPGPVDLGTVPLALQQGLAPVEQEMVESAPLPVEEPKEPPLVRWDPPEKDWKTLSYTIAGHTHTTGEAQVLGNDILVIPNAVPFIMRQLCALAERLDLWQKPTVVRGEMQEYDEGFRLCKKINVTASQHADLTPFANLLSILEGYFILAYQTKVNPYMAISGGSGWELLCYGPGQYFKKHVDQVHGNEELIARRLSVLAFHEVGCVGGELVYERQDVTLKPETGMLVVVPGGPEFPHEALPVEEGFKYTLVSFFM